MHKSSQLSLVLLGTLGSEILLSACSDEGSATRIPVYSSQVDCMQDWKDSARCSRNPSGSGYVGPRYYWDRQTQSPVIVESDGAQTSVRLSGFSSESAPHAASFVDAGGVARGGFGSTAAGEGGAGNAGGGESGGG